MDAGQRESVAAAIDLIVDGDTSKKPNVADVREHVDFDVSADDRDEAWIAYVAAQEGAEEAPAKNAVEREIASRSDTTTVSNRHGSALNIRGVKIPAGESAEVPGLDVDQPIIRAWIDAGVIELG